jgi:hypothetical protein
VLREVAIRSVPLLDGSSWIWTRLAATRSRRFE